MRMEAVFYDPVIWILGLIVMVVAAILCAIYILSYWRRYYLVAGLLFSLLLGSFPVDFGSKNYNFFYSEIVFAGVFAVAFSQHLLGRIKRNQMDWIPRSILPVVFWTGLYFGFSTLSSVLISTDLLRSLVVLKQIAEGLLLLMTVWTLLRGNKRAVEGIVAGLPMLGLGIAVVTLYSGYVNSSGDLGELFSWDKSYFTKNLVESYLGRNNYLAGLMVLLLPVSIAVGRTQRGARRWVTWGCIVAMLIGVLATSSRGAVAALVGTYFLWIIMVSSWMMRLRLLLFCVAFFGALYAVAPETIFNTLSTASLSYNGRVILWQTILPQFMNSPFLGLGRGVIRTETGGDLHNSLFRAFFEAGILGGLAFMALMITIFFGLYRSWFILTRSDKWGVIQQGVFYSVVVAIIHSLGEPLLENTLYDLVFWSIVGIGYALPRVRFNVKNRPLEYAVTKPNLVIGSTTGNHGWSKLPHRGMISGVDISQIPHFRD